MTTETKPLDVEVRELLESRRGQWQQIADGAKVSHSWISQFVRGKIPNPGFATLTSLRDYLAADESAKAA
jgi:transcriptional regulator with XRE-family HTH domain